MKKIIIILATTLLLAFLVSSCKSTHDYIVTPGINSVKTGEARKTVWFGIAKDVDVSIATAAKNGGITKIATVDYSTRFGFLRTIFYTKVTGE